MDDTVVGKVASDMQRSQEVDMPSKERCCRGRFVDLAYVGKSIC